MRRYTLVLLLFPSLALAQISPPSAVGLDGVSSVVVQAPGVTTTGSSGLRVTGLAIPAVTATTGTGTLGTGTYYYWVSALSAVGETPTSSRVSRAITGPAGVTLLWTAISGATGYRIYGRSATCNTACWMADVGAVTSWTDNGSVTPGAGSIPNGGYPSEADSSVVSRLDGSVGIGAAPSMGTTFEVAAPASSAENGFALRVKNNWTGLPRYTLEVDGWGGTHVRDYFFVCQSDWGVCLNLFASVNAGFGMDGDAAGNTNLGIIGGTAASTLGDFVQMRTYDQTKTAFYQMPLKFVFHDSGILGFGTVGTGTPALKADGAALSVRLGDDSAGAQVKALGLTTSAVSGAVALGAVTGSKICLNGTTNCATGDSGSYWSFDGNGTYLPPNVQITGVAPTLSSAYSGSPILLQSSRSNGASSSGFVFQTYNTFSTAGSRIAWFQNGNGGPSVMDVRPDGITVLPATLGTCGDAGHPEGTTTTVAGVTTTPTKMCFCTYTPTGTVYAWLNVSSNTLGNTTTCP